MKKSTGTTKDRNQWSVKRKRGSLTQMVEVTYRTLVLNVAHQNSPHHTVFSMFQFHYSCNKGKRRNSHKCGCIVPNMHPKWLLYTWLVLTLNGHESWQKCNFYLGSKCKISAFVFIKRGLSKNLHGLEGLYSKRAFSH